MPRNAERQFAQQLRAMLGLLANNMTTTVSDTIENESQTRARQDTNATETSVLVLSLCSNNIKFVNTRFN